MDDAVFDKILHDIAELDDLEHLLFTFGIGEATLHPDLKDRVRTARKRYPHISTEIITNGTLMSKDYLLDFEIDTLTLSVLGGKHSPHSYEEETGLSYSELFTVIDNIVENNIDLRINLGIAHPDALETIEDFKHLSNSTVMVHYYNIFESDYSRNATTFVQRLYDIHREYREQGHINVILNNVSQHHNAIIIEQGLPEDFYCGIVKSKECSLPEIIMSVDVEGNVRYCACGGFNSDITIGSVLDDSLLTLFNNPTLNSIRYNLRRGLPGTPTCKQSCHFRFQGL